jgi:hypothetical protein
LILGTFGTFGILLSSNMFAPLSNNCVLLIV